MKSIKNGSYSDPSVWDSSGGDRIIDHHIWIDQNVTCNERLYVSPIGKLEWRGGILSMNNKNLVYEGVLYSRPVANKTAGIRFTGINMNLVQGGGMVELPNDIGLWGFMRGRLDIEGSYRNRGTFTTGTVAAGATSVTVVNCDGWKIGDQIVVCPTKEPYGGWNFNDSTLKIEDPFFENEFDIRVITGISGKTISFSQPIRTEKKMEITTIEPIQRFYPEVLNLTSDFIIEGTETGYAHHFHTVHNQEGKHVHTDRVPQNKRNVAGRFMGPRKGSPRTGLITGRYASHFHHCGDSMIGSTIYDNVYHTCGNRVYVPHMSNGMHYKGNAAFNSLGQQFWWDDRENSHSILFEKGFLIAARWDMNTVMGEGALLGMGDDNIFKGNVISYCNQGDVHNNNGGVAWNADSEGVWGFMDNLIHSCVDGMFIWQNTGNNHRNINTKIYNCLESIQHGAYINSYGYHNFYFYKALTFIEATSGNSYGVVFKDCIFDSGGEKYCVQLQDAPVSSDPYKTNKFIGCKFGGYPGDGAGIEFISPLPTGHPDKMIKCVDIINCDFSGTPYHFNVSQGMKDGYRVRVQPANGQAYQTIRRNQQNITENIPNFAPKRWDNGTGLNAEYYLGANFDQLRLTRIDSMIMFDGWSPDPKYATYGVHHLVQGDVYSVRWTGKVIPQMSGTFRFPVESWGGVRLWVNNQKILDVWTEFNEREYRYSSPINLIEGQAYDIKLEHFNTGGSRGCHLFWQHSSMPAPQILPDCQLFPVAVTPPPVQQFPSQAINGQYQKNDCLPTQTGSFVQVNIPAGKYSAETQAAANSLAEQEAQRIANTQGACTNKPPMAELKAISGGNRTIQGTKTTLDASQSTGTIAAYKWYADGGPNSGNFVDQNAKITEFNGLVPGTYKMILVVSNGPLNNEERFEIVVTSGTPPPTQFKSKAINKEYTRNNCAPGSTGSKVMVVFAEGAYTSTVSQADADQKAETAAQNKANAEGTCATIARLFTLIDDAGKTAKFELLPDGTLKLK